MMPESLGGDNPSPRQGNSPIIEVSNPKRNDKRLIRQPGGAAEAAREHSSMESSAGANVVLWAGR